MTAGAWLITAVGVPAGLTVGGQLFAERSRREHLRVARDQFELAALLDERRDAAQVTELRRRAAAGVARYLQPSRRRKYLFVYGAWGYTGVALALLVLAWEADRAEAGPPPWWFWVTFGVIGAACGAAVASIQVTSRTFRSARSDSPRQLS